MTKLEARADELFRERYDDNLRRTDRLFAYLMVGQWLFAIAIAIWFSPYGWSGKTRVVHIHVYLAVFLGAALSGVPIALALLRPGWVVTRYVIAVAQMLWSALLIHLTGGRIETHFHVFGSLAFLAFYRDWKVLVPATVVVAADHFIRQMYWPESVYGIPNPESWRFLEHAFWVVFEDVFLVIATITSVAEMKKIALQNARVEMTERAAREMEIAANIQTSILPTEVSVPGLEIAARMVPADQVGGDYYDILPVAGGCWIAIGDVAGHGVRAGLTMLHAQAALAALVRQAPNAPAADQWAGLNATFYDAIRNRLKQDEHMTLSLLRYHDDGRIELVGAHEDVVIWRATKRTCEVVTPVGTWIGVSTGASAKPRELRLERGDVLLLYTDGIIEARDEAGEMVGIDAVRESLSTNHERPVKEIRDAIFNLTESRVRDDDQSVLVFRYTGTAVAVAA